MSELINNAEKRKELLKHMIKQLHEGEAPEQVKNQLMRLLGEIPYGDVVEVEQQLIEEGLPEDEILKLCDIHSQVLKGNLDHSGAKEAPAGHPVHTFQKENRALEWETGILRKLFKHIAKSDESSDMSDIFVEVKHHFISLADVEKHYQRKENLLFPFLEKHEITGPPKVMWGKHDETRAILKGGIEAVNATDKISAGEAKAIVELTLQPVVESIEEMIFKEEEILFPMCLDTLTDDEWFSIYKQSVEIGFCIYDPTEEWIPEGITAKEDTQDTDRIQLPSGSFTPTELNAILNSIPFDLTFVDRDDTVRYFTQGKERIFARNRAILGRKVQMCHPPSSVHVVQQIVDDFRSGKRDQASFWIQMQGKFLSIEYFALRSDKNIYLGTLEVSQDITAKRALEGEQRLLSYQD